MKTISKKIFIATAALFVLQGAAFAQSNDTGWYAGGSIGASKLKPKADGVTFSGSQDTSDTGYKLLGGYQFNANWAAEAQFQDLGKWKYTEPGLSGEAKVRGLSVAAVGLLPMGNGFTLLGKLGIVHQTFKVRAVDTSNNDSVSDKISKTTPLVGVGAEYALTPALAMRAEYEYFGVPTLAQSGNEKLKAHTALFSVGLRYKF